MNKFGLMSESIKFNIRKKCNRKLIKIISHQKNANKQIMSAFHMSKIMNSKVRQKKNLK